METTIFPQTLVIKLIVRNTKTYLLHELRDKVLREDLGSFAMMWRERILEADKMANIDSDPTVSVTILFEAIDNMHREKIYSLLTNSQCQIELF